MASYSLSVLLPLYYEGALAAARRFAAGLLLLGPVLVNAASSVRGRAGCTIDVGAWPLIPAGFDAGGCGAGGVVLPVGTFAGRAWSCCPPPVIYVGHGLAVRAFEDHRACASCRPSLYPHGASINSTLVQVASAIGSSLFVGVLSADVLARYRRAASRRRRPTPTGSPIPWP